MSRGSHYSQWRKYPPPPISHTRLQSTFMEVFVIKEGYIPMITVPQLSQRPRLNPNLSHKSVVWRREESTKSRVAISCNWDMAWESVASVLSLCPHFSPLSFISFSFSPLFIILSATFIHSFSDIGADRCKDVCTSQCGPHFTAGVPRSPAQVESVHEPWAGKQVWLCS